MVKVIGLDKIIENKCGYSQLCGIYFLIKDNSVVYVGQSKNMVERIHAHARDKDFDSYYFLEVDSNELNNFEAMYITLYQPEYNKIFPKSDLFISFGALMTHFDIGRKKLKKVLFGLSILPVFQSNQSIIYNREIIDAISLELKR